MNTQTICFICYTEHMKGLWPCARPWLLSVFLFLAASGYLVPSVCFAEPETRSILLVAQNNRPFTSQVVNNLKSQASLSSFQFNQIDYKQLNKVQIEQYQLIVTMGSMPAKAIANLKPETAVLNLLITRQLYTAFKQQNQNPGQSSALILDQPLRRQMILTQYLLGDKIKLGFLLGPYSIKQLSQITNTANELGIDIAVEKIEHEDNLIPSVKSLINNSNVIFSLPDPVAFNSNTIRGILLLSYKNNIPVIGFSKSFVSAGALAAIYSSPEQIALDAGEIINQFILKNDFQKPLHHPEYYSIITNNQVARTLGITVDLNNKIVDKIKELELSR